MRKSSDKEVERKRKYYLINKEKLLKKSKEYQKLNKEKCLAAAKKRYYKNKELIKLKNRNWYKKNKLKHKKLMSEWYLKNKDELSKKVKVWKSLNPGKVKASKAKRRAAEIQRTPKWLSKQQKAEIIHIYNTCPKGHHVDHIIPLRGKIVSGLHVPWNLQHLPAFENQFKGAKLINNTIDLLNKIADSIE